MLLFFFLSLVVPSPPPSLPCRHRLHIFTHLSHSFIIVPLHHPHGPHPTGPRHLPPSPPIPQPTSHFALSWILFKQSVFRSPRSQYVLIHFASFYRNFSLKGYHTIKVPTPWFIGYGQMERECSIVRILGSGERRLFIVVIVICLKGMLCSFVVTTSVTLTCTERWADKACTVTTTSIYVSYHGFHYCKNISRVSANDMVQRVSQGTVVERRGLVPSFNDHRNAVGSIPDGSGCRTFRQNATWRCAGHMRHTLKAEKPVVVQCHTVAHCLLTFSGVPCQWRTFILTITCLSLVTSSWTHQRWPHYAYLHWPTMRRFWMYTRRPSKHNARPKLTEKTSHRYPSKHDPMSMITCQNDCCCMGSHLGQNATCGVHVP